MARYEKVSKDETIADIWRRRVNPESPGGPCLELEGICRGVISTPLAEDHRHANYRYEGVLQRPNGEFIGFWGIGYSLEGAIAKASSETAMPVTMQVCFSGELLSVQGLKLGNIKSYNYQEE
ncbi:MAG TPA: hypothetical protein HA362_03295 [Nanoarchaeota archaeon]|nr:hypothetical protein [Nanoarchaeota archaeon]